MGLVRSVLAVVLGIAVGFSIVTFGDFATQQIAAPPEDFDPRDFGAVRDYMQNMPAYGYLPMIIGWTLATFAASAIAAMLAACCKFWHALATGGLLLLATLVNLVLLPHPTWVVASGALFPLLSLIVGAVLFGKTSAKPPELLSPAVSQDLSS